MMYSSVLLLALAQACAALSPVPDWKSDYRLALQLAQAAQKPLAVFIGSGQAGWKTVSDDKDLTVEVRRLLADKYICLYVDVSQRDGKTVAESFEASELPTIVLSDKSAGYQVYRHSGTLGHDQLAQLLDHYALAEAPPPPVQATIVRPSYYEAPPIAPAGYSRAVVPCRG